MLQLESLLKSRAAAWLIAQNLGGLLAIPWALNLHRDLRACLSVATAISLLLKGRMKHGTKDFCLHMDKAANEVC